MPYNAAHQQVSVALWFEQIEVTQILHTPDSSGVQIPQTLYNTFTCLMQVQEYNGTRSQMQCTATDPHAAVAVPR